MRTGLKLLLDHETIGFRIAEISAQIDAAHARDFPVLVAVLKGAVHFVSEVARRLSVEHDLEFVRVGTYPDGRGAESNGAVAPLGEFTLEGRSVLLVDDILDTGRTDGILSDWARTAGATSIRRAYLLAKTGAVERSGVVPDFLGFEVPDEWVVGFGMDWRGKFRSLPEVFAVVGEGPDA